MGSSKHKPRQTFQHSRQKRFHRRGRSHRYLGFALLETTQNGFSEHLRNGPSIIGGLIWALRYTPATRHKLSAYRGNALSEINESALINKSPMKPRKIRRTEQTLNATKSLPGRRRYPAIARQTFSASTVAPTSCTRTPRAPCATHASAAATLPCTRSAGASRPVKVPIVFFRDQPASTG